MKNKKIIGIVITFLLLVGLILFLYFIILPKFKFSNLRVIPAKVYINETFELMIDVENIGMITDDYTVKFFLDDLLVGTDSIKVEGGKIETARLSKSKIQPGIYTIKAKDQTATLKVFDIPTIKNQPVTDLTHYSAAFKGELAYMGLEETVEVFFKYRIIGDPVWIETPKQVMSNKGFFSQIIRRLEDETSYEFQAVVRWREKESTSNILTFTTPELIIAAFPSVIDNPEEYLPEMIGNYAKVISPSSVYVSLTAIQANKPFTSFRGFGIEWVNVHDNVLIENQKFYYVSWGWDFFGWVTSKALSFPELSQLRGVKLQEYQNEHLAMVFVDALTVRSEPGVIIEETAIGYLKKYDLVSVQKQQIVNGAIWYQIALYQWIHSGYVRDLIPGTRPERINSDEKWIEINLNSQTIYAHEGDTPVYASLISSGRPGFETITGLFRPWVKLSRTPMSGAPFDLLYELADVPWVIFFKDSYALHGSYWHDYFGTARSAGCVNLSPFDAYWFFHWSEPKLPPETHKIWSTPEKPITWIYVHF
jgi:hypothetical protein